MAEERLTIDDLEVSSKNGKYFMLAGGSPLKTPQGKVIWADSVDLFERIKVDYEGVEEVVVDDGIILSPRFLSSYVLASTKTDFIDAGADFSGELAHWLSEDPFFQPTAGHPIVSMFQDEKQEKAAQLLRSNDLPVNVWGRYELNEMEDIVDFFQEMINSLSAGRKAALPNMGWPAGGQFVMTLMYLSGKVSANEWAEAIFSRTEDVCRIIGDQPVAWNMSMSCDLSEEERAELIASIISGYESSCAIVDAFLVSIGEH